MMKITDFDNPVTSTWLLKEGRRLDAPPFLSGAVEARILLEKLTVRKEPLHTLTKGHKGGIYNGPIFKRRYVQDPDYGVPFITSSSMLQADLSNLPYLNRKDAHSSKLSYLELTEGTTLISCSGTIGRMVYTRPDMAGMWSSQDVMKVVPDPEKIPPGYLYAFLSSTYGVPLVVSGTYGAIIQHIEPDHIADLPIPRLGIEIEQKIHELVVRAANLRSKANVLLADAIKLVEKRCGVENRPGAFRSIPSSCSETLSSNLQQRFDAAFHSRFHMEVVDTCMQHSAFHLRSVVCNIEEPNRFRRVKVDKNDGVAFFGTSQLFNTTPVPLYHVPNNAQNQATYQIKDSTLLVPRSGQVSGIIGIPVLPIGKIRGGYVSEDAIRICCHSPEQAAELYVLLRSQIGFRQLKSRAYGSSIPHLDVKMIGDIILPTMPDTICKKIQDSAIFATICRNDAIDLESQAHTQLRRYIRGK
jgi:type I restriction enzyme S subunit